MRQAILDFPKQFRIGLKAAENIQAIGNFDGVIVCGMGGSALPAGILNMWIEAKRSGMSLDIHSDYGLPRFVKDAHLIICISYSGNTEETISAFEEARRKNLKIAAISSGGKLTELCKLHKIPLALIPSGLQPRMALGFQFAALMKILANCGLINADLKDIHNLENSLNPVNSEDRGKKIAKNLKTKSRLSMPQAD